MCDCFGIFLTIFGTVGSDSNAVYENQFEVSVTSIDSPGDNNIELVGGIDFINDLKYYYTKIMDIEDYNLFIPIEGSPKST
ncbi:hypothetical protein RS030_111939 [Cryptosporidium xiaoi]|uniref:Uncharacterized protein n=1 Tax=Cryptosporidium xiaoi TaxID=659607 RepID=A0AAV9Y3E8_9CRYT